MINELDKNTVYKIIFSYFKDKNKTEFIVENLFIANFFIFNYNWNL